MTGTLPTDAAERNEYPLADGLLYYFPAALAAVARVSKVGNDQHNPGEPMHWARGKSTDHANKIIRHQMDAGTLDSDNTRHSAKVAWRALAQLQEELEREEGAPLPRNAWNPEDNHVTDREYQRQVAEAYRLLDVAREATKRRARKFDGPISFTSGWGANSPFTADERAEANRVTDSWNIESNGSGV